jgi:hypothetical protein
MSLLQYVFLGSSSFTTNNENILWKRYQLNNQTNDPGRITLFIREKQECFFSKGDTFSVQSVNWLVKIRFSRHKRVHLNCVERRQPFHFSKNQTPPSTIFPNTSDVKHLNWSHIWENPYLVLVARTWQETRKSDAHTDTNSWKSKEASIVWFSLCLRRWNANKSHDIERWFVALESQWLCHDDWYEKETSESKSLSEVIISSLQISLESE